MRILHVIQCLSPRYGGPVSVLKALAAHQSAAGHVIDILTTNQDVPGGILRPAGADWFSDPAVPVRFCRSQLHAVNLSIELAAYLHHHIRTFDILHIHGLYRFPAAYAGRIARRKSIPYLVSPHGALDPYLYQRSDTNLFLKRLWERLFDLPNLDAASGIHFTAEDERRQASFLGLKAPSFVVANGIDWREFQTLPDVGPFRRDHGIGEHPLVLFLGRLHHKKGLDLLIPAFRQVRRAMPHARLAIVGLASDAAYQRQVDGWIRAQGLADAVHRVPFVQGRALLQAYVDADVFVLPSYTENFGMTVVESLACKTPVVISNRVNIHHEISDAGAGIVTDCDSGAVANALIELLNDGALRRHMGENGRRLVRTRFTWARIVGDLTREYEAAIARHAARRRERI